MIYQSDWQHRRSNARGQAIRRHYQQRPVHLKPLPRARQRLLRVLGSLFGARARAPRVGLVAGAAGLIAAVGMLMLPVFASVRLPEPVATQLSVPLQLPPAGLAERAQPAPVSALESDLYLASDAESGWQVVTVRRNETLGNIFSRLGLSATLMHRLLDESERVRALTEIHPGDQIAFRIPQAGELRALQFDQSESERILVEIDGDGVRERVIERQLERRLQYGSAVISSSLFGAGDAAGLSDLQVMRLAETFNYDIDFAQDLREGDSFAVVYESIFRDGVKLRDGDILAAVFVNRGKRHEAYRYTNGAGSSDFYSADGRSLRKAFIRTPVEFTRISSRFSSARKHPILGRVRAHKGVDYAAPTGTPIRAAGDGSVLFVGNRAGWGRTIEIRHGRETSTLYGHMSRFAKGMARGRKVQQGVVIGYVGMSGLATGPHLHYEFRVKGVHRDPLSVEMPRAEPLSGAELAAFRKAHESYALALATVEEQALVAR
ncbi:MAG: peptidoglycan DD-metalloendopeptidase family protein [Xanthomonadales bacterium]|nr:peptidoglycan DD-metalloendopeptidase family protein [Xanthomonadales bacterium]